MLEKSQQVWQHLCKGKHRPLMFHVWNPSSELLNSLHFSWISEPERSLTVLQWDFWSSVFACISDFQLLELFLLSIYWKIDPWQEDKRECRCWNRCLVMDKISLFLELCPILSDKILPPLLCPHALLHCFLFLIHWNPPLCTAHLALQSKLHLYDRECQTVTVRNAKLTVA